MRALRPARARKFSTPVSTARCAFGVRHAPRAAALRGGGGDVASPARESASDDRCHSARCAARTLRGVWCSHPPQRAGRHPCVSGAMHAPRLQDRPRRRQRSRVSLPRFEIPLRRLRGGRARLAAAEAARARIRSGDRRMGGACPLIGCVPRCLFRTASERSVRSRQPASSSRWCPARCWRHRTILPTPTTPSPRSCSPTPRERSFATCTTGRARPASS